MQNLGIVSPGPYACIGYVFFEKSLDPKGTVLTRPSLLAVAGQPVDKDDAEQLVNILKGCLRLSTYSTTAFSGAASS